MTTAIPSTTSGINGYRFKNPERREASANNELSGTTVSPQKQRLHSLLEKAELYTHFVNNGSSRFQKSPSYISGELRDYQIQALNWLISLYENKIGGILADEMGLGKTIQSIAILGYLKFFKGINGPFLVIGTKSVMPSWMNEFKKFCPIMTVIEMVGDKLTRQLLITKLETQQWDVCITTFDMILTEPFFRHHQWHYVVIDEGHRLKSEKNVFAKFVRQMPSKNRLLLTGTPLQNNLHELWALLNYLMPAIFSDSDTFDVHDEESMKCIKLILQPFFLRRIKADVEASLLPKIEKKLFIGLTKLQRDTYIKTVEKSSFKTSSEMLQDLRKIANHPYLIRGVEPGPPYEDHGDHLIKTSGKMMVLDKLLAALKANGSRVLLFSQFCNMLDIIEDYLDWRKYLYRRLDGQTNYSKRANDIDEFNAENSKLFIYILSTQAGALGINLQTADTVIIFDSDWNPQNDLQAMDRAHRIGQRKQVCVYRFISENTVDECMVQRADVKLHLHNLMIERGSVIENSQITSETKKKVLNFGVTAVKASDKAVITDVNINTLLWYSQQKTVDKAMELEKMNENQLRSIVLEGASGAVSPVQLNSLYVNRVSQFALERPATATITCAARTSTTSVNQRPTDNLVNPPKVLPATITCAARKSTTSVNQRPTDNLVNPPKVLPATITCAARKSTTSVNQRPTDNLVNPPKVLPATITCAARTSTTSVNQRPTDNLVTPPKVLPATITCAARTSTTSVNLRPTDNLVTPPKVLPATITCAARKSTTSVNQRPTNNLVTPPKVLPATITCAARTSTTSVNQRPTDNLVTPPKVLPATITCAARKSTTSVNQRPTDNLVNPPKVLPATITCAARTSTTSVNQRPTNNLVTPPKVLPATITCAARTSTTSVNQRPTDNLANTPTTSAQPKPHLIHLNVHQFYPVQLIGKCGNQRLLNLSTDTDSKMALLEQGFQDWTKLDYEIFCDAVLKYGRFDLTTVADMLPSKKIKEVVKYHEVFFRRGPSESSEINDILNKIILKEMKHQQRNEAVKWKLVQFGRQSLYKGLLRNEKFTADHDNYLVCAVSRYGLAFNVCDRIVADIRFHSDFGIFTTFKFGMFTDQEIKDRINHLVTSIEDEYLASFTEIEIEEENNNNDMASDAKKRKFN